MIDIFEKLLHFHKVPFNKNETRTRCMTHPFKGTLLGLTQLLEDYGFKYSVICIKDKKNILRLPTPFLANLNESLVLVWNVDKESIKFERKGKFFSYSFSEFIQRWSGIVLVVEKTAKSSEPHYFKNFVIQQIDKVEKGGVLLSLLILFIYLCLNNKESFSLLLIASLIIHCLAAFITFFIYIQYGLKKNDGLSAKFCINSDYFSCVEILSEHHIKVLGYYHLSEIGLAFFLGNILFILLYPIYAKVCIPIAIICAIPFTLWSFWYQGLYIKKICLSCLLIQSLVWIQFLTFLYLGYYKTDYFFQNFSLKIQYLLLPLYYFVFTILFHKAIELRNLKEDSLTLQHQLSLLKSHKTVFYSLLEKERKIPLSSNITSLHFRKNHRLYKPEIIIVSNLFCEHCANMHERLQELLSAGFPITYVFMGLKSEGREAARLIINNYREKGAEDTWKRLSLWYNLSRKEKKDILIKASEKIINHIHEINNELERHEKWCHYCRFKGTPTIVVNNHVLPKEYEIENLLLLFWTPTNNL